MELDHSAVAAVQVASYRDEIELNLEIDAAASLAAAAQEMAVVVFPELSLTGTNPISLKHLRSNRQINV